MPRARSTPPRSSGRRPRDREDRQEAGGDRAQARDRRRIPPLLVAFRFLPRPRRRRPITTDTAIKFHGVETKARGDPHRRQGRLLRPSASRAFQVSQGALPVTPKMTIPAPSTFHFRQGRAMVSKQAYPGYDEFFADLAAAWREGDPRLLRRRLPLSAARRHRLGDDVRSEGARSTRKRAATIPTRCRRSTRRLTNAALEGKPADMAITMHSCRGNFRSTLIAAGRLRVRRRAAARQHQSRRLFPRIRQRPRRRLRAAALLPQGQEAAGARPRHLQERRGWSRRTTSSAASTRRPNMSRSISCACRRNAALPRPRRATCWPRTSNGRSCG